MMIKLMKSIPQLTKASLNTQAINLINVVKASFDIPQDYKEHVIALPPHFIETMYDLYRDSMYAACKAGLATLTNVMAKELAPLNITCNTLAVSAIKTDMLAQLPQDKIAQVIAGLPIPRFAEPDDILNVIDFLASDRSSYITAQTIYLGGVN